MGKEQTQRQSEEEMERWCCGGYHEDTGIGEGRRRMECIGGGRGGISVVEP